jgi:hypothetical protein
MITMYSISKEYGTEVLTDKDFKLFYDLQQWQLDKMKEFGLKEGYFNFKTYKYFVCKDNEKPKKPSYEDMITLPVIKKNGRKVKFLIEDVIKDKNIPAHNTYKTFYQIYGEVIVKADFERRIGISESKLRKCSGDSKSFTINGIPVNVIRPNKSKLRFTVTNKNTGTVRKGMIKSEVMLLTGCHKHKTSQMDKFNPVAYWKHYIIEREAQ